MAKSHRRPISVLVVVYTPDGQVLALKRRTPYDFWQSVTGSLDPDETHAEAAIRELYEETQIAGGGDLYYTGVSRVFVIDARWRHRFPPGVVENVEFEWWLEVPEPVPVLLNNGEHTEYEWLPLAEARERFWSWTNKESLDQLALHLELNRDLVG